MCLFVRFHARRHGPIYASGTKKAMVPRFLGDQSEGGRYDLPTPHPPVFPLPSSLSPNLRESDSGKGAPSPTHPPTSSLIRTHPEPCVFFPDSTEVIGRTVIDSTDRSAKGPTMRRRPRACTRISRLQTDSSHSNRKQVRSGQTEGSCCEASLGAMCALVNNCY